MPEREVPERAASQVAAAPPTAAVPPSDVTLYVPGKGVPARGIVRTPVGAGIIVEDGQAPFPGEYFEFANRWGETKDGEQIIVRAGLARKEPGQGIVIVRSRKTNECGTYRTPIRAGGVRIVGAEGERLTLASWSGTTFIFDVARRQFVAP